MAAGNVTPGWLSHSVKWILGLIRSIPLIVVAIVLVTAVGLGPFPGALAIAFHSVGMLAKFFAEEFETADEGILQAVRGTGASWSQTLRHGLLPQSVPQIVAFIVYRLEMNFRDAAVLGLVGAGGIGFYIQLYVRGFQYEKVAVLLLTIIAVVTALDQLTYWVRKWVRWCALTFTPRRALPQPANASQKLARPCACCRETAMRSRSISTSTEKA